MKKKFSVLLILISLAGITAIIWHYFSLIEFNETFSLPSIPPNLNAQTKPLEINLSKPVPILMYHHIQANANPLATDIIVSSQNFETQLKWLVANNFQAVGLDYLNNPSSRIIKPVILTFDDGYKDAYTQAFPLLKKYNFQAIFYVIVNNINKSGFLTKTEILEMQNSGMQIASHSLSHPNLTTIPNEKIQTEIYASKYILEQIINHPVSSFSYPGGNFNQTIENILANSGYSTSVTTQDKINIGKINPLELNRIDIRNNTNFENLSTLK